MEELVSARIFFFSLASGVSNFFRAVHAFFYSHSCCKIFLTVKALQEIFFSNLPLPLSKIKWSTPKLALQKTLKNKQN